MKIRMRMIRLLAHSLFLVCMMGCYGTKCDCTVVVLNSTPYYLHVLAWGEEHLFVSPGGTVSVTADPSGEVTVFISPGQNARDLVNTPIDCDCSLDVSYDDGSLVVYLSDCHTETDGGMEHPGQDEPGDRDGGDGG